MKQKLWMALAIICLLVLAGCGSDDDNRESLPWNSKELFDATYMMNDEGCYVLKNAASPSWKELSGKVLESGWQPVAVYKILSDGKLSQDDYREQASNIDFACLYFNSDSHLFAYYQDYALSGSPLCKKLWKKYTYEENTGILMRYDGYAIQKDWNYLQMLKIKESDGKTYLYTIQRLGNQPREDDGSEPVFGMVIYQRMSQRDLDNKINHYTYDVDKGRVPEPVKVPESCKFSFRVQYAFPDQQDSDNQGLWFQTFRLLSFILTDDKGVSQYPSDYYEYYDSIVWKCNELPNTHVSVSKKDKLMEWVWSTYFFHVSKFTEITAMGYKDGHSVYECTKHIYLYNAGFLGFNWNATNIEDDGMTRYSLFDKSKQFLLKMGGLDDHQKYEYAELYEVPKETLEITNPEENMVEILKETNLVKAMDKIYVSHVVVRDSKKEQCKARFKHLPDDVDVVMTWKDYPESNYGWNDYMGTEMVLVLKKDKEKPQKVSYYVHVESIM